MRKSVFYHLKTFTQGRLQSADASSLSISYKVVGIDSARPATPSLKFVIERTSSRESRLEIIHVARLGRHCSSRLVARTASRPALWPSRRQPKPAYRDNGDSAVPPLPSAEVRTVRSLRLREYRASG